MKSKLTLLLVLFALQMNSQVTRKKEEIKVDQSLVLKLKEVEYLKGQLESLENEKKQLNNEIENLTKELMEAPVSIE